MRSWRRGWVAVVAFLSASVACAAGPGGVAWRTDLNQAWKETQTTGRPLLIVVTRPQCGPCAKLKNVSFVDPSVARTVSASYVPIVLDGASDSPLLKELHVTAYPTTFVVSPNAVVLDRFTGYVEAPALAQRLSAAYVKTRQVAATRPAPAPPSAPPSHWHAANYPPQPAAQAAPAAPAYSARGRDL